MISSLWNTLSTPIIGLSPMDGVTDQPFRFIQKKYGQPALLYTEFTSVEGVCHGAVRLLEDFLFDETQRPIIAQIYGFTPFHFEETAVVLCELGFDGIDINMGCPAKNVAHSGAGAALIRTPQLAQEIVAATKRGVAAYANGKRSRDCSTIKEKIWRKVEKRHDVLPAEYQERTSIPVSIKTRIGFHQPVTTDWIATLLETEPAAIAVHGRTLKQQYGGKADWEEIGKGGELIKTAQSLNNGTGVKYLGNGDVLSKQEALEKCQTYNLDGVLIGRASFGNPYVFHNSQPTEVLTTNSAFHSIFEIALEHAELFETTYRHAENYSFMPMRKHLGWYVRTFPGAASIRQELFHTNSAEEVRQVFKKYDLL